MNGKIYKIIVLIAVCLLVAGCGPKNDKLSPSLVNNPNTANGSGDTTSLPVITFNTTSHDFGELQQGETVMYAFKFKNEGKSDLLISSATSGCKCTSAKISKSVIKPGEEGRIDVSFDPTGVVGFQNKVVKVVTNAQPNIVNLYVRANVKTGTL